MLTPAAKALAYLHGKGFAHGRIKPSNILSVQEELKISGDSPLRLGERHASSPAPEPYDPPELATSGVTAAGDVWSLGVSLVEAMSKEQPRFEGGSLRLPDALRPDSFREVAAGCLERDPARRWTVADLGQWLDRGTVPALKRARPRYLVPVAAAAGVVAVGAVVWTYGGPYLAGSQPAAPESAPATQVSPLPAPVNPPSASAPAPASTPATPAAGSQAPEGSKAEKPAKAPAEPTPEPPSAAASPVVTATDVTSPDVLQPVVPDVPAKSRATIHGKVPIVVRVQADAAGAVTSASVESGASSKYFADMALKAARQWKFVPGADARQWLLRFEFTRDAQHPVAARVILAP